MSTLRRILKYAPAAFIGLLIAGWLASLVGMCSVSFGLPFSQLRYTLTVSDGSLGGSYCDLRWQENEFRWYRDYRPLRWSTVAGGFKSYPLYKRTFGSNWHAEVPFSILLTALTPVALVPWNSFRFRLRHYLAYTALVALELAYYLRWQE